MRGLLLVTFLVLTVPQVAAQQKNASLDRWYSALETADLDQLENAMVAENIAPFEYRMDDLDITQNRAEFIDSMAEWKSSIAGGSIEYKITEVYEGGMTALVCYRFSDSEFLAREDVGVYDTKITGVSQTSEGDSCKDF